MHREPEDCGIGGGDVGVLGVGGLREVYLCLSLAPEVVFDGQPLFQWIRRDLNKRADALANLALNWLEINQCPVECEIKLYYYKCIV